MLDNGGSVTLTVNRPLQYLKIKDYKQYFRPGETVDVRFSHISSPTFDFWSRLENEMLNAMNPVFPAYENLPSNIEGDARGIWSGYGSSYYRITMPQENDSKETTVFRRHSSNESSLHAVWSKRSEKSAALSAEAPRRPSAPADGSDRSPFADAR